jgi:hypothetical protein
LGVAVANARQCSVTQASPLLHHVQNEREDEDEKHPQTENKVLVAAIKNAGQEFSSQSHTPGGAWSLLSPYRQEIPRLDQQKDRGEKDDFPERMHGNKKEETQPWLRLGQNRFGTVTAWC